MRKLIYPLLGGLILAAPAVHAQDAADPAPPEASAAAPAEPATTPAEPAPPEPAPPEPAPAAPAAATAEFTDEQVDQFAQATVKLQAIDGDTSLAADVKQQKMQSVVSETGLDAATYNKIGKAIAADPELRQRVQVAMTRHAGGAPTEG